LDKSYTILVVPDRDAKVKKIRVEHRVLVRAGLCLGLVGAALAGAMAHYFNVVGKVAENKVLRDENLELQNRWREAEQKFAHINDELDRVKRLNANLRTSRSSTIRIGSSASPGRAVAWQRARVRGWRHRHRARSGRHGRGGHQQDRPGRRRGAHDCGRRFGSRPRRPGRPPQAARRAGQEGEGAGTGSALAEELFEDQQALLASAPSIWPVRGWVTSDYSVRLDPYTGERVMHEGLDIATAMGRRCALPPTARWCSAGSRAATATFWCWTTGTG